MPSAAPARGRRLRLLSGSRALPYPKAAAHPRSQLNHQLQAVPDARPYGFERFDIVAPVAAMKAQLQCRKTTGEEPLRGFRYSARVTQGARRCISTNTVGQAAEQLPAGLAGDGGEIPQREIQWRAAAIAKLMFDRTR